MDNMMSYLKWRGDLSFTAAPFCEVDNLILSDFSYIDFTDIVSSDPQAEPVRLYDAVKEYFDQRKDEKISLGAILPDEIIKMARLMAMSRRFGRIRLSHFINHIDEQTRIQFSALTCHLEDGSACVVYRGTDDTIVGWKESFSLSFDKPIPAQKEALEYLRQTALHTHCPLRIMGHSKGGNLAVYAAAFACDETQSRILGIYNNDGPGFSQDIRSTDGYGRIRERLHTFVPQTSIVGMLLEHEEDYVVVKSRQIGVMQHDGFSWELDGPSFTHLDDISAGGHLVDSTLRAWVGSISEEHREKFVEALFSLFESTGAKTLTELNQPKNAGAMMKALQHMDKESKDVISQTFSMLYKASAQSLSSLGGKKRWLKNL